MFSWKWVKKPPVNTNLFKQNWGRINKTPIVRAGLLIRKIMRGSIRQVKPTSRPSRAGTPPRSRDVRKRFKWIMSWPYDSVGTGQPDAAVIGHVTFKNKGGRHSVQSIHEWGRRVPRRVFAKRGRKAFTRKQARAARKKYLSGQLQPVSTGSSIRMVKYPPRPFAFPALKKAQGKLAAFWRNSISTATVRGR